MKYVSCQHEYIRRWDGLEVPVDEAIDALRAALYIDLERTEAEKNRLAAESSAGKPLSEEESQLYRRSANIHFTLHFLDQVVVNLYALGMTHPQEFLQKKIQMGLFDEEA